MSDWDAVFSEAALGLDLAKADAVRDSRGRDRLGPGSLRHPLAIGGGRSSVLTEPGPPRDQPAVVRIDPDTIFRQEALEFRARGHDTHGGVVRLGSRWIRWAYRATVAALALAIAGALVIHTDE